MIGVMNRRREKHINRRTNWEHRKRWTDEQIGSWTDRQTDDRRLRQKEDRQDTLTDGQPYKQIIGARDTKGLRNRLTDGQTEK